MVVVKCIFTKFGKHVYHHDPTGKNATGSWPFWILWPFWPFVYFKQLHPTASSHQRHNQGVSSYKDGDENYLDSFRQTVCLWLGIKIWWVAIKTQGFCIPNMHGPNWCIKGEDESYTVCRQMSLLHSGELYSKTHPTTPAWSCKA